MTPLRLTARGRLVVRIAIALAVLAFYAVIAASADHAWIGSTWSAIPH